jgi:penicillin-binding protein-related factor A (putative recombinase)
MAANNGKRFEQNIKASCEKQGILFERFVDGNKWGGGSSDTIRFTPDSPCDGFIYWNGILIYLELKTACTGSISFNNPPDVQDRTKVKPSIKAHQVKTLLNRKEFDGVEAGLLVEFSDRVLKTKTIYGGTYYIDINDFYNWAVHSGKKSMNVEDAERIGLLVHKKMKKVNADYDIERMLKAILD